MINGNAGCVENLPRSMIKCEITRERTLNIGLFGILGDDIYKLDAGTEHVHVQYQKYIKSIALDCEITPTHKELPKMQ